MCAKVSCAFAPNLRPLLHCPFVSPHGEVRVYVLYLFSLPTSAALSLRLLAAAMKATLHKPPPAAVGLVCLAVVLLAFVYLVIYPKEFELQSFVTACRPSSAAAVSFTEPVTVEPDFRLLLGVLTSADLYERRHLLRLVYSLQTNLTAHVDVRFVLCNLTKEEQRVLVAMEIMRYDDIIILNCTENMNEGKTYAYFASPPKLFDGDRPPYDFVVKADDDIYFRLPKLIESLKKMPREDLYYGFVIPYDGVPALMGLGGVDL
ncbi:unnamed protein product, partial [Musa banksii]